MIRRSFVLLLILVCSKASFAAEYILSAPPTETREVSERIYQPIATYISSLFSLDVAYQYPGNWPSYIRNMQDAQYDFLIDAPHFVSWRVEKIEHNPLVSLSDEMVYVVVVQGEGGFTRVRDLKGMSACGSAIPNLDTLTLLDQYDSPWTQPLITVVQGFDRKYDRLLKGDCHAAILPRRVYNQLAEDGHNTRILFESQRLPHLGLSVSPRVGRALQESIRHGLLLPAAIPAFRGLNNLYALNPESGPVAVDPDNYRGFAYLVDDFWGF